MDPVTRRRALAAAGAALAGLAGCAESGGPTDSPSPADQSGSDGGDTGADGTDGTDDGGDSEDTAGDGNDGETATGDAVGTDEDLDLREANVTGVAVDPADGGYRFEVTLYHDDDGEDGYANWWQVETPAGERLGRRDLAHPHGTREFTRSETVEVPEGVGCVVVRGHDETHGYGGRAALVAPDSGASRAVEQGSEPDSFEDASCP